MVALYRKWPEFTTAVCDHLSENPSIAHTTSIFFKFLSIICIVPLPKFQPFVVSSFGITSLESRKNKEIDLYSDYTKNKLQALAFAAMTSIWISLQSWNLAYNVHHGLADQPRYGFCLAVTCAYAYEGGFVEEMAIVLFTYTAL